MTAWLTFSIAALTLRSNKWIIKVSVISKTNNPVVTPEFIRSGACGAVYHQKCAAVTRHMLIFVNNRPNIHWDCHVCNDGNRGVATPIDRMNETIGSLSSSLSGDLWQFINNFKSLIDSLRRSVLWIWHKIQLLQTLHLKTFTMKRKAQLMERMTTVLHCLVEVSSSDLHQNNSRSLFRMLMLFRQEVRLCLTLAKAFRRITWPPDKSVQVANFFNMKLLFLNLITL